MYGRSALGSALPLVGLAASMEEIPGSPVASALQATAGAGFLLYLLVVLGLFVARLRLRVRPSVTDAAAAGRRGWAAENGS
ncbi:hypothetical protein A6A29_40675 [Streptomyces sp. TSRI0281]|nr:hypothetical protein A6A29_40675 [Streptomyces sp. TSRI0281]